MHYFHTCSSHVSHMFKMCYSKAKYENHKQFLAFKDILVL